jgi:isopenicillin N synthase-like dioxygenase
MPEKLLEISIAQTPRESFRIFYYPPSDTSQLKEGEHLGLGVSIRTYYGLITILASDSCGGLQV